MEGIHIKPTLDGSDTLYVPSIDEHYHSTNGAVQESAHVYIDAGLAEFQKDTINILEIGFGTGLNAYLTYRYAHRFDKEIDYTGIELYPLDSSIVSKLNYADKETDRQVFQKIHTTDWGTRMKISSVFFLTKIQRNLTHLDFFSDETFDLIYFDAFAPDKQPEMWTQDIFDFLYKHTTQDGILTTYCAKGSVRRMLQKSGYKVERLPGPPGKREMIRAIKIV